MLVILGIQWVNMCLEQYLAHSNVPSINTGNDEGDANDDKMMYLCSSWYPDNPVS